MFLQNLVDRHLRAISMYRIVSIALLLLLANAFVLSLFGQIAFSPWQITASAIVLILATTVSSRLFASIMRTHAHSESAFITALILFFIVSPTSSPEGLFTLVFIGVIASASKYLLAYKGRHIFNPAAIAAVLVGISGLASISWWVATPSLIILTAVLSLLILYKTHRFHLGLLFIALTALPILLVLLAEGLPASQAILALAAWPILFFIGFMLTEPLTLPAKKWQLYVEVALVALLFAQPILMNGFSVPPALALVIGNLFAFIVHPRRSIELRLVKKTTLTPTTDEFVFAPKTPVNFEPGQYMEIMLPHKATDSRGLRRTFSISSAPMDDTITFGVKFYEPSSSFKKALRVLPVGSVVKGSNIAGDFTLPDNTDEPLLFVAGGIGITPFMSHIQSLRAKGETRDIILLYAVNDASEIAYADTLKESQAKIFILTKSGLPKECHVGEHISGSLVTKEILAQLAPDISSRWVYISGPPVMVASAKKDATRLGAKKIKTDYFTGY